MQNRLLKVQIQDPDNTRTPLILWGSGVRAPIRLPVPSPTDEYTAPWQLERLARRDVEQADISVLMSALLGSHWPVNSVGVLPDIDPTRPGYLQLDEADALKAGLVNAQVGVHFHSSRYDRLTLV
jgi:GPI ethanolamine phosphate transferase 1